MHNRTLLAHPLWLAPILALSIVRLMPGVPGQRPRRQRAFVGVFLAAWPVFWLTELLVQPQLCLGLGLALWARR